MKLVFLAALGGAVGSAGRYSVGVLATRLLGIQFPYGTLMVNIAGSFLMGVLISLLAIRFSVSNEVRTFLAIGILGGFTTFSSFALDVVVMIENKRMIAALSYVSISVLGSILALFLGLYLTRILAA